MARKARQKTLYTTYLISQGCDADVFTSAGNETAFENALLSAQKHYGFLLIAASIDPCSYHLMLFDNGNDISKIMRSINIGYAMAVDSKNFKFKRRFKSVMLESHQEMLEALSSFTPLWDSIVDKLIEGNTRVSAKSFTEKYLDKATLKQFLSHGKVLLPCEGSACYKNKLDAERLATENACKNHIQRALLEHNISMDELKKHKSARDALIVDIRRRSNLTLVEIGKLFDGMSGSAISKIIKQYNE